MIKVLSIVGTRPEAIKMAPVIRALESAGPKIKSLVCATGQHREMLDHVLDLFQIVPDYDLNVMQPGQTPSQVAALIFGSLESILVAEKPDWVLVQGDTTTVVAASMAAFYNHIHIGHVEAGLRTRDKWHPFPEEINRRVAGVVADLHFAPTKTSQKNLLAEGTSPDSIVVTGNTVIDALQWVSTLPVSQEVIDHLQSFGVSLEPVEPTKRIVVTAHRRENHGEGLESICRAIKQLAVSFGPSVEFVYPVHLNPNVQEPARRILDGMPNVKLLPPLEYLPMVALLRSCYLVLTDSGGLQEEAPGLGKPVLVLRKTTERPEGVEAGTVRLVGTDWDGIVSTVSTLLTNEDEYLKMATAVNPYGDGMAAERIVAAVQEFLVYNPTPASRSKG